MLVLMTEQYADLYHRMRTILSEHDLGFDKPLHEQVERDLRSIPARLKHLEHLR